MVSLRTVDDSRNLRELLDDMSNNNVVIVGSGFIGLELASAVTKFRKNIDITIVGREKYPLSNIFGDEIGESILTLHISNGVKFQLNSDISEINIQEKCVRSLELRNGNVLQCDIVVLAIGARPSTEYLASSGLLKSDGSIEVDNQMRVFGVSQGNVFAAGDIVTFPAWFSRAPCRIEHWNVAIDQGRIAGYNVARSSAFLNYSTIPFFWTMQYSQSLRFVGSIADGADRKIFRGDPKACDFEVYYVFDCKIVAVATMNRDPLAAYCKLLLEKDSMPSPEYILSGNSVYEIKI